MQARNCVLCTFERANGQPLMAKPYVARPFNWTKGIDQRPASRSTTIPARTSRSIPDGRISPSRIAPGIVPVYGAAATISIPHPTARKTGLSLHPVAVELQ